MLPHPLWPLAPPITSMWLSEGCFEGNLALRLEKVLCSCYRGNSTPTQSVLPSCHPPPIASWKPWQHMKIWVCILSLGSILSLSSFCFKYEWHLLDRSVYLPEDSLKSLGRLKPMNHLVVHWNLHECLLPRGKLLSSRAHYALTQCNKYLTTRKADAPTETPLFSLQRCWLYLLMWQEMQMQILRMQMLRGRNPRLRALLGNETPRISIFIHLSSQPSCLTERCEYKWTQKSPLLSAAKNNYTADGLFPFSQWHHFCVQRVGESISLRMGQGFVNIFMTKLPTKG